MKGGRQREEEERKIRELEAAEKEKDDKKRRQKNMDDVERIRRNYIQKVLFNAYSSNRPGF